MEQSTEPKILQSFQIAEKILQSFQIAENSDL